MITELFSVNEFSANFNVVQKDLHLTSYIQIRVLWEEFVSFHTGFQLRIEASLTFLKLRYILKRHESNKCYAIELAYSISYIEWINLLTDFIKYFESDCCSQYKHTHSKLQKESNKHCIPSATKKRKLGLKQTVRNPINKHICTGRDARDVSWHP